MIQESKEAIAQLMNEYCYRIDAGDLEGFAALFENGSFGILGDPAGPDIGKAAVRETLQNVILYDGKPCTKHVMSNVQIELDESGKTATAQCYMIVFQAIPNKLPLQAIFGGHYHDRFARGAGGWYFVERAISPDLLGDLSLHRADMA